MTERVVTSYHSPRTPIPMNWGTDGTVFQNGGGTNPFSTIATDPNENNFPVWYATGQAGMDGNFTVALTGGFSPTMNLVAWEYNRSAKAWIRLGSTSGTYQLAFDATYTQGTFQTCEGAIILIQSEAAVTEAAYMDGTIVSPQVGAPQEGF